MQFTPLTQTPLGTQLSTQPLRQHLGKLVLFILMVMGGVGAAVVTSRMIGPLPFSVTQTTTQKQTTFDVTGKSELYTVPDEAEINVGANITQSTVALAQKEA